MIRAIAEAAIFSCIASHCLTKSQDVIRKPSYAVFVTDRGSCELAGYKIKEYSLTYVFKLDSHKQLQEVLNCSATGRPIGTLGNCRCNKLHFTPG
jgi:hypothetical protein